MTWLITPQLKVLNGVPQESILGIPFGGGYFAGYISHTADGNPTHALIVAPRATGATGTGYTLTTMLQWKTAQTSTTGTTSSFDGAANTAAMVTAGIADHPAAEFCKNLNIGGFTDWYLPARFELDIAYFNLKPSTANNNITAGVNGYAVPARTATYTLLYPAQTAVTAFNTSSEAFSDTFHWASDQFSATTTFINNFASGQITGGTKTTTARVRAFRRIAL
jgi:hypothetical protein